MDGDGVPHPNVRLTGDEHRRAVHEVGHFMVARALGLKVIVHYLTLELREVTGGGFGVQLLEGNSTEELACMYLGGLAAELIDAKSVDVALHVSSAGGNFTADNVLVPTSESGDLGRVFRLLGEGISDRLLPLLSEASALLRQSWADCDFLSKELTTRHTLYAGEAEVVLAAANAPDDLLRDEWWFEIELYRCHRRRTTAPDAWFDGVTAETPAGPYYEGFRRWRDRDGRKEREDVFEWIARLSTGQVRDDHR